MLDVLFEVRTKNPKTDSCSVCGREIGLVHGVIAIHEKIGENGRLQPDRCSGTFQPPQQVKAA